MFFAKKQEDNNLNDFTAATNEVQHSKKRTRNIVCFVISIIILMAVGGVIIYLSNLPAIEGRYNAMYYSGTYLEFECSKDSNNEGTYYRGYNGTYDYAGTWKKQNDGIVLFEAGLGGMRYIFVEGKQYLICPEEGCKGDIPSGNYFDATFTNEDGDIQYTFKIDGTYEHIVTYSSLKETGVYVRENEIIRCTNNETLEERTYLIYEGGIHSGYQRDSK